MVHGHLDEPEFDMISMTADNIATDADLSAEARELAEQPRFGYNGYYVGGWWEMVEIEGDAVSRYRFWDTNPGGGATLAPSVPVVARSPGTIRDPSNLIIFCSSTQVEEPGRYRKWLAETPGWHLVTPPILANQQQWLSGRAGAHAGLAAAAGGLILAQGYQVGTGLDDRTLEAVATPASVPIGRYTGQVAVVYADLHCATESPGALSDQRKWIYSADTKDFTHSP